MKLVRLFLLLLPLCAGPAAAQNFPQLTGRVVDAANLLDPAQEAELTQRLEALEQASSRQLVVATVPSLEDRPIEEYGYQLGRHWRIGQSQANNGTILLVAPTERKVRIEVGYGLEGILTDALSHQIIEDRILPRFREGDMAGGIVDGAGAIIEQLGAPPEQAEQRALQAAEAQRSRSRDNSGGTPIGLIFWMIVLFFLIIPMLRRAHRGRRYGRRRGAWGSPVVIWGGGGGWGSSGSGWGGGGGGWGGGGGGFSGGGGSFGGGGASGGW
ncbi:MAG TPA: TPM domain-containing protein [Allosphingosinicella sp.]|jgi:uncharacterized protein